MVNASLCQVSGNIHCAGRVNTVVSPVLSHGEWRRRDASPDSGAVLLSARKQMRSVVYMHRHGDACAFWLAWKGMQKSATTNTESVVMMFTLNRRLFSLICSLCVCWGSVLLSSTGTIFDPKPMD